MLRCIDAVAFVVAQHCCWNLFFIVRLGDEPTNCVPWRFQPTVYIDCVHPLKRPPVNTVSAYLWIFLFVRTRSGMFHFIIGTAGQGRKGGPCDDSRERRDYLSGRICFSFSRHFGTSCLSTQFSSVFFFFYACSLPAPRSPIEDWLVTFFFYLNAAF